MAATATAPKASSNGTKERKKGPRPYMVLRQKRIEVGEGKAEGGGVLGVEWEQLTLRGPAIATTPKDAIRQAVADSGADPMGVFVAIRQDEFKTLERQVETQEVESWR